MADRNGAPIVYSSGAGAVCAGCGWPSANCRRVAIARALAMDPPLLMMDEPTASLDQTRRRELGALLHDLAGRGRSILISTHDEGFAADFATAVLTLDRGAVASTTGGRARDS